MFTLRNATIRLTLAALAIVNGGPVVCRAAAYQTVGRISFSRQASVGRLAVPGRLRDLPVSGRADDQQQAALTRAEALVASLRSTSFPELARVDILVREFQSKSDYFRTRISIARCVSFCRMRFFIEVNLLVFARGAPEAGLRAIIAHELEHVLYLSRRNRLQLLPLARLASQSYTARFERSADLGALERGYGSGLILYRLWLYQNIPSAALPRKLINYFSPDEIALIQALTSQRPELFGYWLKHVPRNLAEIQRQAAAQQR